MIKRVFLLIALLLPIPAVAQESATQESSEITTPDVTIEGNTLYFTEPGKEPRALLTSKAEINNATLSPDGTRIAFLEGPTNDSRGFVRVVDLNGKTKGKDVNFETEAIDCWTNCWLIKWLNTDIVQADKHINPSLDVHYLFNLTTGKLVTDIYDAGGYALSNPGFKVAYIGDIPHWSPADQVQFGSLYVDGAAVTGLQQMRIEYDDGPYWSPDERYVAVTAHVDRDLSPRAFIIDAETARVTSSYALEADQGIKWDGTDLVVFSDTSEWRITPSEGSPPKRTR